jgi:hypothetical protein
MAILYVEPMRKSFNFWLSESVTEKFMYAGEDAVPNFEVSVTSIEVNSANESAVFEVFPFAGIFTSLAGALSPLTYMPSVESIPKVVELIIISMSFPAGNEFTTLNFTPFPLPFVAVMFPPAALL